MIEKLAEAREWIDAGAGFDAKESFVRLTGWSRQRRAIVLRRRIRDGLALAARKEGDQPRLSFVEIDGGAEVWEYSVLVTSLDEETSAFGQLYRDRGDSENAFDQLKNQWGWRGFTTQDLARCRLAAQLLALFYDWGTSSFAWPSPTGIAKPSPAGRSRRPRRSSVPRAIGPPLGSAAFLARLAALTRPRSASETAWPEA